MMQLFNLILLLTATLAPCAMCNVMGAPSASKTDRGATMAKMASGGNDLLGQRRLNAMVPPMAFQTNSLRRLTSTKYSVLSNQRITSMSNLPSRAFSPRQLANVKKIPSPFHMPGKTTFRSTGTLLFENLDDSSGSGLGGEDESAWDSLVEKFAIPLEFKRKSDKENLSDANKEAVNNDGKTATGENDGTSSESNAKGTDIADDKSTAFDSTPTTSTSDSTSSTKTETSAPSKKEDKENTEITASSPVQEKSSSQQIEQAASTDATSPPPAPAPAPAPAKITRFSDFGVASEQAEDKEGAYFFKDNAKEESSSSTTKAETTKKSAATAFSTPFPSSSPISSVDLPVAIPVPSKPKSARKTSEATTSDASKTEPIAPLTKTEATSAATKSESTSAAAKAESTPAASEKSESTSPVSSKIESEATATKTEPTPAAVKSESKSPTETESSSPTPAAVKPTDATASVATPASKTAATTQESEATSVSPPPPSLSKKATPPASETKDAAKVETASPGSSASTTDTKEESATSKTSESDASSSPLNRPEITSPFQFKSISPFTQPLPSLDSIIKTQPIPSISPKMELGAPGGSASTGNGLSGFGGMSGVSDLIPGGDLGLVGGFIVGVSIYFALAAWLKRVDSTDTGYAGWDEYRNKDGADVSDAPESSSSGSNVSGVSASGQNEGGYVPYGLAAGKAPAMPQPQKQPIQTQLQPPMEETSMEESSQVSSLDDRLRRMEESTNQISVMADKSLGNIVGVDMGERSGIKPFVSTPPLTTSKKTGGNPYLNNIDEFCEAGRVNMECSSSISNYLDSLSSRGVEEGTKQVANAKIISYLDSVSSTSKDEPKSRPVKQYTPARDRDSEPTRTGAAFSSYLDALSSGSVPAAPSAKAVAGYLDELTSSAASSSAGSSSEPIEEKVATFERQRLGNRIADVEERLNRLESSVANLPDDIALRLMDWQLRQDERLNDELDKIMKYLIEIKK